MNTADPDFSGSAQPKRPARITGKATRRSKPSAVAPSPDEPLPGFDEPASLIVDQWLASLAEIGEAEGAFGFEVLASSISAVVVHLGRLAAAASTGADPVVPLIAELSRRRAALPLALLTCFGYLNGGTEFGTRARLAAEDMRARGIVGGAGPSWLAELDQPLVVEQCVELQISANYDRLLLVAFSRGAFPHGLALLVNGDECDEASMIVPIDPRPALRRKDGLVKAARELLEPRTRVKAVELDPAEARFRLETAVSRRADHDAELDPEEALDELFGQSEAYDSLLDDEDPQLPYLPFLPLLTARLEALPEHGRELPPHPVEGPGDDVLQAVLEKMMSGSAGRGPLPFGLGGGSGFGDPFGASRRKPLSAMPKKRRKSDGPAPVYRVRIDLRDSKPPIWRRLELAGDATLADVHRLIQLAFAWEDYHLHAFETDYGSYGNGAADLGHRDPASVTLEQLLRAPGEKLRYTYDFGDDWVHVVKLEAILDADPGLKPRCTAGRRAAPPEDCGGIWAYEQGGGPAAGADSFDRDELNQELIETF